MNIPKIPLTNIYYFDIILVEVCETFTNLIIMSITAGESILALYKYLAAFCFGGFMQEVWKDVKGYEGLYQVSNCGVVKSKDRCKRNNGGVMLLKGREIKPQANSNGYLRVQLVSAKGDIKRCFIHRLVAEHFVENHCPELYEVVNHIDGNCLNNNANNLEWTTQKGNIRHAIKNGRMKRTKEWLLHLREANELKGTPVIGVNIKTQEKIYFACLNDCKNKGFQPSCVCHCCKGMRKTHKGYKWKYAKEGD